MTTGITDRTRRKRKRALLLLSALVLLGVGAGGIGAPAQAQSNPYKEIIKLITPPTTAKPKPKTAVAPYTRLATPPGDVATYDRPNGRRIGVFGHWYGRLQTSPILESRDGWYRVRLPERPNGGTAWIRSNYVKVTRTPWRIIIRRDQKRLNVYKDGNLAWSSPVGLGKAETPTPLGRFYVGVIERNASAAYGPFQLDTTAHSESIVSWQGSGDAVTAIHGPINAASDRAIGSNGTYISNGCVRMHTSDLQRLSVIPVGTPVDIFN